MKRHYNNNDEVRVPRKLKKRLKKSMPCDKVVIHCSYIGVMNRPWGHNRKWGFCARIITKTVVFKGIAEVHA